MKKKIAIFYPYFMTGGGEAVTAWSIEALKDSYDVSLFTWDKIKLEILNNLYGMHLSIGDVAIINPPLSFLLNKIPNFGLFKYHLLMRYFKNLKTNFDVLFGTYKEIDFGRRGLQYIHFPEMEQKSHELDFFSRQYYRSNFLRNLYKKFCYSISSFNEGNMKQNITLTNSNWTRGMIKKIMDIESYVVSPPVLDDFVEIPWGEREEGFVCIGRISPEKRIKLIIKIISLVRKAGFNVHLHIIGPVGDISYYKEIKQIQKENRWIFIEGLIDRKSLVSTLLQHKYGIHGRRDEHFGIGIVEIVKAGCIIFVPDGGGQVEIVDNPQLIYRDEDDAMRKIEKVLSDANIQIILRKHLSVCSQKFSVESFQQSIKSIVREFLKID